MFCIIFAGVIFHFFFSWCQLRFACKWAKNNKEFCFDYEQTLPVHWIKILLQISFGPIEFHIEKKWHLIKVTHGFYGSITKFTVPWSFMWKFSISMAKYFFAFDCCNYHLSFISIKIYLLTWNLVWIEILFTHLIYSSK